MSTAAIEAIFAARGAEGFRLVVGPHPRGGYECRRFQSGELIALEGALTAGYPGILEAVQAADAAIRAQQDARREALAVRIVDELVTNVRLRPRMVDVDGVPVRHWEAQDGAGNWTPPRPTVWAASRQALGVGNGNGEVG